MIEMLPLKEYIIQGKHQFHNITKKASYVVGIDINRAGIKQLKELSYNVEYCDVFSDNHQYLEDEYDYVVLSHVLEHIVDLTGFLEQVVNKVKTKEFIFAVPNAYNIKHALPTLLLQRERVSNDHYYTFTPITFIKLIEALEFEAIALYFDQDRTIRNGNRHVILGRVWSYIKSKVFTKSGDIILIARSN
ncbi:class I SAM-dependent methyltransferase [Vibrio genomosp. F10 str. 9ZC157]|uniref:Methyltransferase type 12 n=1 Tax=Vibrio genomosp. F10 str. ZF-129 TaxID=1187848 RepID=A0A1E5BEE6_9VIBR|nr:methyltransferase domain-containing protein [Vibrio genomosp. F10]OEE33149.1 hypothetical protein A1QO_10740 [Vibrio genomosp. F10 str. ZF-129]OEE95650.1 hypothetical protein A1QM_04740 [Vibrio genomosp. F10 str. 9ZC157]